MKRKTVKLESGETFERLVPETPEEARELAERGGPDAGRHSLADVEDVDEKGPDKNEDPELGDVETS